MALMRLIFRKDVRDEAGRHVCYEYVTEDVRIQQSDPELDLIGGEYLPDDPSDQVPQELGGQIQENWICRDFQYNLPWGKKTCQQK